MKTIENKTTTIPSEKPDTFVNYANLLKIVLDTPVKEGVTVSQMRRDIHIMNKVIEGLDAPTLSFEDDEFAHIVKEVEETKWLIRHVGILDFSDYISGLK